MATTRRNDEHLMPTSFLFNRVLLIVLDGARIGAMPDASEWGDAGADTFGHILESRPLRLADFHHLDAGAAAFRRIRESRPRRLPSLQHYELGNIRPLQSGPPLDHLSGSYGRCA